MKPIEEWLNGIHCGNAYELLRQMPSESVDCVITSPPYYGLRDYGSGADTIFGGDPNCEHEWSEKRMTLAHENRNFLKGTQEEVHGKRGTTYIRKFDDRTCGFCVKCGAWRGQLGLEPNWGMYVEHLVELFREVKRVLKSTGSFWLNVGDTYSDKNLLGIPWRVAFALIDDGWILRNAVIWYKPSHMPESIKDRLTRTYEYVFHFVKSKKYFYNLDNIREPHKAGDNIEEILRYWGADKHGEYRGKAVKDYESARAQNVAEVERRIIENLKSKYLATDVGTASPAARSIKMSEKLTPQVKQKVLAVGAYLKNKLTESGYTIKQLAEITGIKQTTLEHYFRTDFSGQMLPSREDWNLLKPLLGLGEYDEYIDEEIRQVLPQPHPIGRNPGDVWGINMTKHDLAVGRVGNFSYTDPLHTKGYYPLGKNPGDLWSINTRPFKEAHFATFPPELPLRPILASCPPDGVVLDPLAGSGTVAYVCELINRGKWDEFRMHVNETAKRTKWNLKWIMIEINPEYCKIMEKRLEPFMKQKSLDYFQVG
jgi:DNA modification methylase